VKIGTLANIHRYPVKSMLGETLERATLGEKGIPGDRAWAVRDEVRGGIRGGKQIPALMKCAARYLEQPGEGAAPAAQVTLPDGEVLSTADADAAVRIGRAVGREVTLWPIVPAEQLDHYRRGAPDNEDFEQELRGVFARTADEPLPDLGRFPPEILEFESPPGTYFDAFPLLILTTQSLRSLADAAPDSKIDVRRFRPSLVIDTDSAERFPEQSWIGRSIEIAGVVVEIVMECPRCVMTTHGFADLPRDPGVMRRLVSEAEGNFGVYANVTSAGEVSVGDSVRLLG